MSQEKISKARDARELLTEAQLCGRDAREIFEEIGDSEGAKKAGSVEEAAAEGKAYVDRRIGKCDQESGDDEENDH